MVSPKNFVDVIIVGAGLSGLRAATRIHSAGLSYLVLEAEDRVGGKVLSVPAMKRGSSVVDMGAAWINNSSQSEMFALAQEFGFDLEVQRAEGNSLFEDAAGNVSVLPFGLPAPLRDEQIKETETIFNRITEIVDQSNLENPHLGPDAASLDNLTALEFAEREFGSELAKLLVKTLVKAILGVEASEISALYLINYIKGGTGIVNISSDLQDGGQYLRNRQGNQAFATKLAEKLSKDSVKLSTPVVRISQSNKECTVTTRDGKVFRAKKVILSIPSTLYSTINFVPQLPPAKKKLGESTKLGYWSKTTLIYQDAWWRDAGLSGVFTSTDGPIGQTRDTSVDQDGQYSITAFHLASSGRQWSTLSPAARQEAVLSQLNAAFGSVAKNIPKPTNIIEQDWTKEEWFKGAPCPIMGPRILTSAPGKSLRDSFNNIHFIGTETGSVWKGYMEGAIRSGDRGAGEVISDLRKRV